MTEYIISLIMIKLNRMHIKILLTGKRLTAQKKVRKCEPDGETTGIRTPDTRLRRPLLYPAEL